MIMIQNEAVRHYKNKNSRSRCSNAMLLKKKYSIVHEYHHIQHIYEIFTSEKRNG